MHPIVVGVKSPRRAVIHLKKTIFREYLLNSHFYKNDI